jgi:hypothetical protein
VKIRLKRSASASYSADMTVKMMHAIDEFGQTVLRIFLISVFLVASNASAQRTDRIPVIGFIDRTGEVVEPATWHVASEVFSGDWVAVSRFGKWGYLNLRTGEKTGLIFDELNPNHIEFDLFAHGAEPVKVGRLWGYADKTGTMVIAPRFTSADRFDKFGYALVESDFSKGIINQDGKWVLKPEFLGLRLFGESEISVYRSGLKWGLVDRVGNLITAAQFNSIGSFAKNGLAPATLDGGYGSKDALWGYIDKAGEFVIPLQFKHASNFTDADDNKGFLAPDGQARVTLESGENAFIDAGGKVLQVLPEDISVGFFGQDLLARFRDLSSGKSGLINVATWEIVAPAQFDSIGEQFVMGLAEASIGDEHGFIDKNGRWVIGPGFDRVYAFTKLGQAQVEKDGQSFLISRDGEKLTPLPLIQDRDFFSSESEFAAFTVYPGEEIAPTERFGRWELDSTLFALPRPPMLHAPSPLGFIKLSLTCSDGLGRFEIMNADYEIRYELEIGSEKTGPAHLGEVTPQIPATAQDALDGFAGYIQGYEMTLRYWDRVAREQPERAPSRALPQTSAACVSELMGSGDDLSQALEAMRIRSRENGI